MSLSFQNKIVFPAPESSYTSQTAYGQVVYIPRNILSPSSKCPLVVGFNTKNRARKNSGDDGEIHENDLVVTDNS